MIFSVAEGDKYNSVGCNKPKANVTLRQLIFNCSLKVSHNSALLWLTFSEPSDYQLT